VLDNASPPESQGGAAVVEAVAPPAVRMAGDEASHLRVQLDAIQEEMDRSEREAAVAAASHAKGKCNFLVSS
jgi:hypothetical protein